MVNIGQLSLVIPAAGASSRAGTDGPKCIEGGTLDKIIEGLGDLALDIVVVIREEHLNHFDYLLDNEKITLAIQRGEGSAAGVRSGFQACRCEYAILIWADMITFSRLDVERSLQRMNGYPFVAPLLPCRWPYTVYRLKGRLITSARTTHGGKASPSYGFRDVGLFICRTDLQLNDGEFVDQLKGGAWGMSELDEVRDYNYPGDL